MAPPREFLLLLFLCLLHTVSAQFFNFDQMFGGGGHHQQQHHQQQQHRPSGESLWAAQADHTSCTQYLCPTTLTCVSKPADCPCPSPEDVKCIIPDADADEGFTAVCVRGGKEGCAQVEGLTKPDWAKR